MTTTHIDQDDKERLRAENEALRARLEKADDTLGEMLSANVDALFVAGVDGPQIFTLKGADQAYRTLIEEMSEGALTLTTKGVILYANRRFADMLKAPLERVIGATLDNWIGANGQATLHALLQQGGAVHRQELVLTASDGTLVPIHLSVKRLPGVNLDDYFCLVATDMTEQKHNEAIVASEKLARELLAAANRSQQALLAVVEDKERAEAMMEHANRALAALSAVNRTLVHAENEEELLGAICRAIVQQHGYRFVWVGYVQHDERKSVRVMAHAGPDDGLLDVSHTTWADSELGMAPSGRAVQSGTTQLCQDIAKEPSIRWREAILQRGCAAEVALPLLDVDGAVFGILSVHADETNAFVPAEVTLLEEMAADMAYGVRALQTRQERNLALEKNEQQLLQLQDSLEDTVRAISTIVEMRDPYTAGHQLRVAALAAAIATEMGLSDVDVHAIHIAGMVHDLGKVQVPAEILSKPGKISENQYRLIKDHPQAGYEILKGIDFAGPIAQMVLQHHERIDGSGYPQGLKGEEILQGARILCVADVVEAMSSHRPYRPALGIGAALDEIRRASGTRYDRRAVDACLSLFLERGYVLP